MSNTQKPSFSLLTQKEVDTLVAFLNNNRENMNSDVMNQHSIDKLINLITSDSDNIILDLFDPLAHINHGLKETLDFYIDKNDLCELCISVDDATGFIVLTAYNTVNGKALNITPKLINENDTEDWGRFVSPLFFNRIAYTFNLKYTTETHNKVCNIFAEHMYGTEKHKISQFYLPANAALLECIL